MTWGHRTSGGRQSAEADAAFRRRVEDARARVNISDVIGRHTTLKRAGKELVGLCVFHRERTASLRVNDAKGTYHCFGCASGGDALHFLTRHEGLSFLDALRDLEGGTFPEVDPAERARAAEEDAAEREAAIAEAREIWERAVPAAGTPAEIYTRSRGIVMPLPPTIRFTETYAWRDKETGEVGPNIPALIGAVTNGSDEVIAIQRIFLRQGGRAKARMKKPKLSLGRVKGGALKLDCAAACGEIIITEGPEDALSIAQEMPDKLVWCALGTAFMPFIEYPPTARSIVIAGQNDAAGRAAVTKAAEELVERGYLPRTMWPAPEFKDWNDQLRGIRS